MMMMMTCLIPLKEPPTHIPRERRIATLRGALPLARERLGKTVFWTVGIHWPGMSEPQKYEAVVDTGVPYTLIPSRHVGGRICFYCWRDRGITGFDLVEAGVSLTGNDWKKHPVVTGPEALCILG